MNEIQILKNERALNISESKKIKYLYENEKQEKEVARKVLKEAESDTALAYEAFNRKLVVLRLKVQDTFKSVENKAPQNDQIHKELKEIEKGIVKAIEQNHVVIQKADGEKILSKESYKKVQLIGDQNGINESSEDYRELHETKKKLWRLERIFKEIELNYSELQKKYEYLMEKFTTRQLDNQEHVKVIEQNLKVILRKLQVESSNEEDCLVNRSTRPCPQKLVASYRSRAQDNSKINYSVEEIRCSNCEVATLLEEENTVLREGLVIALEKMKVVNSESENLRNTLEQSLEEFKSVLSRLERTKGDRKRMEETGKEEYYRENIIFENKIRNLVEWLKESLTRELPEQQSQRTVREQNNNFRVELEDEYLDDVLQSCERHILGVETEKQELKRKINLLLNQIREGGMNENTLKKTVEISAKEKSQAIKQKEDAEMNLENMRQEWTHCQRAMQKCIGEVVRTFDEVKREEKRLEDQQQLTCINLIDSQKGLSGYKKKGRKSFL